jgi:hypothetical protein
MLRLVPGSRFSERQIPRPSDCQESPFCDGMAWRRVTATIGLILAWPGISQAQQRLSSQCPLIVPAQNASLQPRRILPSQVQAKNGIGCLSPSDAIYGPDGCPVKMCGPGSGTFQLPAAGSTP